MLPANRFPQWYGAGERSTTSRSIRSSGSAARQRLSPRFPYATPAIALPLSSPSTNQRNASDRTVGASTNSSRGTQAFTGGGALRATRQVAKKTAERKRRIVGTMDRLRRARRRNLCGGAVALG